MFSKLTSSMRHFGLLLDGLLIGHMCVLLGSALRSCCMMISTLFSFLFCFLFHLMEARQITNFQRSWRRLESPPPKSAYLTGPLCFLLFGQMTHLGATSFLFTISRYCFIVFLEFTRVFLKDVGNSSFVFIYLENYFWLQEKLVS